MFALDGEEWKSTLLGIILGITSFGVESTYNSKIIVESTLK